MSLERRGQYEEAIAELGEIWSDLTAEPQIAEFDARTGAEILLRCGSLLGFLGHLRQIPNSQEHSKDLLTVARENFLKIYDPEKIAECENYMALAYWRAGELNEAEIWIGESLARKIENRHPVRLYSYIIKNLILLALKRYPEIFSGLTVVKDDFQKYGDYFLKGNFHNTYSLALKNLGHPDLALSHYEKARIFFRQADNKSHQALVENNLALLYQSQKRFAEAHLLIDCGIQNFAALKDRTREGFALDTKAQIFLAERKFSQALETVEKAIEILQRGENAAYLTETLLSKVKILLKSDDFSAATMCLVEAVQIANTKIGENEAKRLVAEFETAIKEKTEKLIRETAAKKTRRAAPRPADSNSFNPFEHQPATGETRIEENLKLILPSELKHFTAIQAIWINNRHLESVGLVPGLLAVIGAVKDTERGDLIAVSDIETDAVSCGFYEKELGIVCLEGDDGNVELFDEEKIKIVGKIIGICNPADKKFGKLPVRPLSFDQFDE